MPELRNCPFCGSAEISRTEGKGWIIFFTCDNPECGAITSFRTPDQRGIAQRWNRRALATTREAFEAWISAMPYERDITRWPDDAEEYAWFGQYCDPVVDLAWHSWAKAGGGDD